MDEHEYRPIEKAIATKLAKTENSGSSSPRDPLQRFRDKATRKSAIDAKCWDCTCQQREEIRRCPMTDCPLYEFRPYK